MTTILDKPRIRCCYKDGAGNQCPLDALEGERYCRPHLDMLGH